MNRSLAIIVIFATTILTVNPANAGIFDLIRDIRNITGSANTLLRELGYTKKQVKGLGNSLGINLDNVEVKKAKSGTDIAIPIYEEWMSTLSLSDREIIQQLTLEYAAGRLTSIEGMMISSWFQGLSSEQQPRVIGLFAKFNQILELVDNKNAFLAGIFLPGE